MQTRFGNGAGRGEHSKLEFAVDAELIVYGVSRHDHVTLKGEPVQMRPDGTFAVRLSIPDRREVIPVVASSGDGVEQRTIVLAIERNPGHGARRSRWQLQPASIEQYVMFCRTTNHRIAKYFLYPCLVSIKIKVSSFVIN